ncbi:hypothetical protein REPUB_Repub15cG0068300 [Reevesia pubescens]
MLSSIPAIFSSSDLMLDDELFPAFESGFTSWDCSEIFSTTQSIEPPRSGLGSDEPKQSQNNSNPSLNEPKQSISIINENKRRRMISNRDAARRSRMRKQKHLENLRNEVKQLRIKNQELNNQLRSVSHHYHRAKMVNDRLRSEYSMLQQGLADMCRILLFKQLQQISSACSCNNVTV